MISDGPLSVAQAPFVGAGDIFFFVVSLERSFARWLGTLKGPVEVSDTLLGDLPSRSLGFLKRRRSVEGVDLRSFLGLCVRPQTEAPVGSSQTRQAGADQRFFRQLRVFSSLPANVLSGSLATFVSDKEVSPTTETLFSSDLDLVWSSISGPMHALRPSNEIRLFSNDFAPVRPLAYFDSPPSSSIFNNISS